VSAPDRLPPTTPSVLRWLAFAPQRVRVLRKQIDRARAHSGPLDAALATIARDSEIGGPILAGAVAYRLFVFALPLGFFLVSGLGVLERELGVDGRAAANTIGLAGLITRQVAGDVDNSSSWWVALTSFLVLVYVTRVLVRALAIVHALAWERSAAAVTVGGRSLGVLSAAIVGQLALVAGVGAVRERTPAGGVAVLAVSVLGVAGLWLAVSLVLPRSPRVGGTSFPARFSTGSASSAYRPSPSTSSEGCSSRRRAHTARSGPQRQSCSLSF
jgi:hypothetical protein